MRAKKKHPSACARSLHAHALKVSPAWSRKYGKPDTWLFLIRHGRASGNHRHIFNGKHYDAPLTRLGYCQAKLLAGRWPKKHQPDLLYCSTLKRARSTARPLARRFGLKVHPRSDIVEQDFGNWAGKSARRMRETHPAYFFRYPDGRLSNFVKTTPGGESWKHVISRARKFLLMLKRGHAGKTVAVVAHGVFLLACVHLLTGARPPHLWELRFTNAGRVMIEI